MTTPARRRPRPKAPAPATLGSWSVAAAPDAVNARPATTGFADLGLPSVLVAALAAQGLTTAFPIQSATLPDTLKGRDVLGRGRTGSGKTLAFSLPVVTRLAASGTARTPRAPRALVLAPTRELASQINATLEPLARVMGLRTTVVFGGVGQNPQVSALKAGVDVLIACPGRLEDLISQGHCDLSRVEVTVLDEADHMADLGFLPGVRRILSRTPARTQRLLFSATLDNGVGVLVQQFLHDPLTHSVDESAAPPPKMTHHVLVVTDEHKSSVVRTLARGQGRSVLFTRTKHGAKKLAKQLTTSGVPAVDLHGNLSQNARERNLAAFSSGTARVLVATDIAARGIHVDEVALVVHVDPPNEHKAYLHRSGRTARAGAEGLVVTVRTPDQAKDVADLVRLARISPRTTHVDPDHPLLGELTGPHADLVTPLPAAPAVPAQRKRSTPEPARTPRAPRGGRTTTGTTTGRATEGRTPRRAAPRRRP